MPRRLRYDAPGLFHHVMSRGIARRTVFETRRDIRFFLALLALEVRARRVEVLAFSILTTHFHLLVRSVEGELDGVMQRVLNQYVRHFNRTRRRDGPLFRSRYRAKPVRSHRHRRAVLRYIDQNAPEARLASHETLYPYGSARLYVARRRPLWLATEWADRFMGSPSPEDRFDAYLQVFGVPLSAREARFVERRLELAADLDDDWDDLVAAAPPRVLAWMQRKASLADGSKAGLPYADPARVEMVVEEGRVRHGDWSCRTAGTRKRDAWPVLHSGLLHGLAGMTQTEIGGRLGCSANTAGRRVSQHSRLVLEDEVYARRASELGAMCLPQD